MARYHHKRRVSNYLLKPRFQFKYGLYFLVFGVFASLFVQWLSYVSLRDAIIDFHVNKNDQELLQWLDPTVIAIGDEYFYFLLFFGLACFIFGIWITHRVVGPSVAIKRFISELRKGKFGHQIKLRDNDQLCEIADELNDLSIFLAESFEERKPQLTVIESKAPEKLDEEKKRA